MMREARWLTKCVPASSEGKRLFVLGLLSVVAVVAGSAFVFALLSWRAITLNASESLEQDAASLARLLPATQHLATPSPYLNTYRVGWICDPRGTVCDSSRADLLGQKCHDVAPMLESSWHCAALIGRATRGSDVLYLAMPDPGPSSFRSTFASALGYGLLLLLLMIPFFHRLGARWVGPIEMILAAEGPSLESRLIPPPSIPLGLVRHIAIHRNLRIEALKAKEDALLQRSQGLEALYELSRQLGLSRLAPDVPNLTLSFLSRVLEYDAACMVAYTDKQCTLTIRQNTPLSELLEGQVEELALNALYDRTGILLDSKTTERTIADPTAPRVEGKVRSSQWAPLNVNGRIAGLLGIIGLRDRIFAPEAVRMLGLVAQNCSLALDKLALQRMEETQRFQNVLEHLAEGVVLLRRSGEWALATGPARELHRQICGTASEPVPHESIDHSRECPIGLLGLDVFHSGTPIRRELTRNHRTFILGGTFVQSSAAGEHGAVVSVRDVTDERATQQKLFQASKLASLGELAAGVAHEVNNPLTGILGFTELLLARSDLTAPVAESLQEILLLARRTNQITMDLLLFARVQREGGFRPFDVRATVRDTIKLFTTSYRGLRLRLVAELGDERERLLALGDQGKLLQVVMNLAQNAKDAILMGERGSTLSFRTGRHDDNIWIEIEDDGPGIPDEVRSRIFEPFFTTKPIGKGTGLGLAIVSRIIEEHKGKLTIDTEVGRGTLFHIDLPSAPADAEVAPMESLQLLRIPSDEDWQCDTVSPPPLESVGSEEMVVTLRGEASQLEERRTPLAHPPFPRGRAESPAEASNPSGPVSNPKASAATAASPPASPRMGVPAPNSHGKVLVLDDEVTVLKFLTRALQVDGFEVFATSDPDEALRLISEHNPDLLFLDYRMPTLTGEEFYHLVVSQKPDLGRHIVFLSGDTSGSDMQSFLQHTGAPALSKPIGVRELRSFVSRMMESFDSEANPSR